jgi:hypothetical protein
MQHPHDSQPMVPQMCSSRKTFNAGAHLPTWLVHRQSVVLKRISLPSLPVYVTPVVTRSLWGMVSLAKTDCAAHIT